MDSRKFDLLSRALSGGSRRQMLKGAVAAVAGASIPVAAGAQGVIVCRLVSQSCTRNAQCCSGYCDKRSSLPRNLRNRCGCSPDQTACNGVCVDLDIDRNNCGACGNVCGAGEDCCSGECVDVAYSEDNCGHCGHACGAGDTCCAGDCDDLKTSEDNCGACGNACGAGEDCCNGACRDVDHDANNCGACGRKCSSTQECFDGVCKDPCVGSTGKVYMDNDGLKYTGFKDSDPWGVACTSNEICEENDRCSGDPNNPCICRERICLNGKTQTHYTSPQCADLDRA
jgi:hypothetical protein